MDRKTMDSIFEKRLKSGKLDQAEKEAVLDVSQESSVRIILAKLGIDKMLKTTCDQCKDTFLPSEAWQLYHCPKCGAEIKIA